MKHKHEKWIHLMADGVRIEKLNLSCDIWEAAYLSDFDLTGGEFRIAKQEKKWRWMYAVATNNTYDSLYLTAPMTEAEAKAWVSGRGLTTLGPRQDWTEVECD